MNSSLAQFNIEPGRKQGLRGPKVYPKDISFEEPLNLTPLLQQLQNASIKWQKSTCIEYFGKKFSYAGIWQDSIALASALEYMGVKRGDRVIVVLPNIPETAISILATLLCGGILVMSNPLLSEEEHRFQVEDSGAKLAIVLDLLAPRFAQMYANKAEGVVSTNRPLEFIVSCSIADSMPITKGFLGKMLDKFPSQSIAGIPGIIELKDAIKVTLGHTPIKNKIFNINSSDHESSAAVFIYTGGTTGRPKAVELTYSQVEANISQINHWLNFLEDGKTNVLGVFPLFSAAGLTALFFSTFIRGGTLVMIPRPTPEVILSALKRVSIQVFPAVPTIYKGLIDNKAFTTFAPKLLKEVKIFLSGAAPLPPELNHKWKNRFEHSIYELYGMTETTAMAFGNRPNTAIKDGSCGLPIPHLECQIRDIETGKELGVNEIGEICLKGPNIFGRYHQNSTETKKVLNDNWLFTGDVGFLDDDGYLFISGRKKEMVISSGYNVYPAEIEAVINRIVGVAESVCIGIPDDYRGESIKAFVVPEKGAKVTSEAILQHCQIYLAKYKIPKEVSIVHELPKNPLGKILKNKLA